MKNILFGFLSILILGGLNPATQAAPEKSCCDKCFEPIEEALHNAKQCKISENIIQEYGDELRSCLAKCKSCD